jgi:hypothetical protein
MEKDTAATQPVGEEIPLRGHVACPLPGDALGGGGGGGRRGAQEERMRRRHVLGAPAWRIGRNMGAEGGRFREERPPLFLKTQIQPTYFSIKGASLLKEFLSITPSLCIIKMHTAVQVASLNKKVLIKKDKDSQID